MRLDLSGISDPDQKARYAAAFTVGAAGYLLSIECGYSDAERLAQLGEVIAGLRAALDLPDVTGSDAPAYRTGNSEGGDRL
jgi:hypothetical protein